MSSLGDAVGSALGQALRNPAIQQKLYNTAKKAAADPRVRKAALNAGRSGLSYMQQHPELLQQAASLAGVQSSSGNPGDLESRVSRIEQLLQIHGGKSKTRRYRKKQRKTRKH